MTVRWLSEGIGVFTEGRLSVGVLRSGDRAVLIDFGSGAVLDALGAEGIAQIDAVLLTHYHADTAYGLLSERARNLPVVAPADEEGWIARPELFWNDPQRRWHLYNDRPQPPLLAAGVSVHRTCAGGESWQWGPFHIHVFSTPGHTDGSVSYGVAESGNRVVFCGDLIHDAKGRVLDVYSFQKGIHGLTDYHGFLGARSEWVASLELLRSWQPNWIVPSHGEPIGDPHDAVERARAHLDRCYRLYAQTSALRSYFPTFFDDIEPLSGVLERGETRAVPPFLRHFGTTWVVLSERGEAFVMDCGAPAVLTELERLAAADPPYRPTELWITHYHDDHVDALEAFQERHPCPTRTHAVVAEVLERPLAWRLPCISPVRPRIDARMSDGESWSWNEFRMTAFALPGQTQYHAGLLVEGRGERLFFVGDSFTATGMDDYCAANRNPIGENRGFDACLQLLEQLGDVWLLNCHVDVPFRFGAEQLRRMRDNLAQRRRAFGAWIAWDHPDFGLDPHWLRPDPYEQEVVPGQTVTVRLVWTNYANAPRTLRVRPLGPSAVPAEARSTLPPSAQGTVPFRVTLPQNTQSLWVIPFEVWYQDQLLGAVRAALVRVSSSGKPASGPQP